MKTILVTGSSGFLGSHLVRALCEQGHKVIGVDNFCGSSNEAEDYNEKFRDNDLFIEYAANCTDISSMELIFEKRKPDVVFHLAAHPHEGLSVFSPHFITKSIFEASTSVFSAAIQNSVKRIVFASSMARYGKPHEVAVNLGAFNGFYEDLDKPKPVDPYGIAKVAAEDVLKVLSKVHGVEYAIAVPHNIIGINQCYTDPYRNVVSIMMNRLKKGLPIVIYGDGEQTRSFSPVEDCISCLLKLGDLDNKEVVGETFNIGPDGNEMSINELGKLICEIAGKEFNPTYFKDRPQEVKHARCSADKAREVLGFKDTKDIRPTLEKMWEAIPEGGADFDYDARTLEIVNDLTPLTWKNKLI